MEQIMSVEDRMVGIVFWIVAVILIVVTVFVVLTIERGKRRLAAAVPPEVRNNARNLDLHGALNELMICPHCQMKGKVRTKAVVMKKGVSGTKATAALFTAGTSLLATGLSRKEHLTQAWCENCKNEWAF